jgi:Transposase DDE domain
VAGSKACAADIPFRLVVADSIYGENAELENKLFAAKIPYVMGLRPSHGVWQWVEDESDPPAFTPPAFTPAEAAARLPLEGWERTVRFESHGKELVRYIAELELGKSYGPTKTTRLIAATRDPKHPKHLKPESTWYLATSLSLAQVSAEQVDEIYRLRDWIEHFYKPVKHELGWADYQMRPERAIVRHWQLVLLAYTYTFSLLVGALPQGIVPVGVVPEPDAPAAAADDTETPGHVSAGGKIRTNQHSNGRRGTHRVERDAAPSAGMALPLGSAAAVLEAVVDRRPTARTGRAPRPRRPLPPT